MASKLFQKHSGYFLRDPCFTPSRADQDLCIIKHDEYDRYSSSSSQPVYFSQWRAHSRKMVFHTLNRGQRDTRLFTYLLSFATLFCSLPLSHSRSLFSFPSSLFLPSLSSPAVAAAVSLAPANSIPSWSYHRTPTHSPGVIFVSSHKVRSNCVAMDWATVFYLLQMYASITSDTASSISAVAKVYSHFMYVCCCGSLPVNCLATWSWNPSQNRPMQGVTTQVSAPKFSTDWTMALKKNMDNRGVSPLPAENTFQPLPHSLRILQDSEYHWPITDCRWYQPPQLFERDYHIQLVYIRAERPVCDLHLLLRCQAPSISLHSLPASRGASMHPVQSPPLL